MSDKQAQYRIGAVCRLTGIPIDTLRIWERRYAAVSPLRGNGRARLYDEQQVRRLRCIKRLVDAGQAISTVASLDDGQLAARINELTEAAAGSSTDSAKNGRCRMALVGATLGPQFGEPRIQLDLQGLDLLGCFASGEEALRVLVDESVDVLLFEAPTLSSVMLERVLATREQLGGPAVILAHGFAAQAQRQQAVDRGMDLLPLPVDWSTIRRHVLALASGVELPPLLDSQRRLPENRFSERQLARLSQLPSSTPCECPQHVSQLVLSLGRFELYCAECEQNSYADAQLHHDLRMATAEARSIMEQALLRLLQDEHSANVSELQRQAGP